MPEGVERQTLGHPEKKGFRRADRLESPGFPDSKVGLLHHIVDIANRWEDTPQIPPQRIFMHMHLLRKPPGISGCSIRAGAWRSIVGSGIGDIHGRRLETGTPLGFRAESGSNAGGSDLGYKYPILALTLNQQALSMRPRAAGNSSFQSPQRNASSFQALPSVRGAPWA